MNQDQRKFLIGQVESTYKSQKEAIERELPTKPSLNNYLVAAFLDNTIEFNDISVLKTKMRETVLRFGTGDHLIKEDSGYGRRRNELRNLCEVVAEDLFIIPQNYKDALAEYEAKKKAVEQKMETLTAQKNTIIMKIQIGSSSILDKLIAQVDNMGDLNIMNSQLLLTS